MHALRIQLLMFLLGGVPYSLHGMLKENEDNKQLIEQELQILRNCTSVTVSQQVFWNKNSSECAWVTIKDDPDVLLKRQLELTFVGLDKNKELNFKLGSWEGYQYPAIDDQVRPFFDKKGGVFCYGYGRFNCDYLPGVLEYSLNSNGEMNRKKCWLQSQICCSKFLNFPLLLQAILRSTKVRGRVRDEVVDKVYAIDGVTIPADYKTFKQHEFYKHKCLLYEQLDDSVTKIIDDQYAKQQAEKKVVESKHDDERNNF